MTDLQRKNNNRRKYVTYHKKSTMAQEIPKDQRHRYKK